MILLVSALLSSAQDIGLADVPYDTPRHIAANEMASCHLDFLEAKGLTEDSSRRAVARWDKAARKACAHEINGYRRFVSARNVESEWTDFWEDYWAKE